MNIIVLYKSTAISVFLFFSPVSGRARKTQLKRYEITEFLNCTSTRNAHNQEEIIVRLNRRLRWLRCVWKRNGTKNEKSYYFFPHSFLFFFFVLKTSLSFVIVFNYVKLGYGSVGFLGKRKKKKKTLFSSALLLW